LTDLCSFRLIITLFPNLPEHLFEQGVLHGDLQSFHYHLVNMNKLSSNIEEVIEFPIYLIVKLILKKILKSGNWLYSSVWTLKKILN
jgi:hypothetical protein